MEDHIDTHVLKEIRAWYEHQLQIKESGTSYYLTKRINQINMLLLQHHEKDYLLSLDALFLMNDSSPTKTSEHNDFTEVGG
jgi:hypothetical protein